MGLSSLRSSALGGLCKVVHWQRAAAYQPTLNPWRISAPASPHRVCARGEAQPLLLLLLLVAMVQVLRDHSWRRWRRAWLAREVRRPYPHDQHAHHRPRGVGQAWGVLADMWAARATSWSGVCPQTWGGHEQPWPGVKAQVPSAMGSTRTINHQMQWAARKPLIS